MKTPSHLIHARVILAVLVLGAILFVGGLRSVLAQGGEGVCSVLVDTLNIRPNANTNGAAVAKARGNQDWLTVYGRNSASTWLYVRLGNNGPTGWVSTGPNSSYLDCEVNIRELPIVTGSAPNVNQPSGQATRTPTPTPTRATRPSPTPLSLIISGSGFQQDDDQATNGRYVIAGATSTGCVGCSADGSNGKGFAILTSPFWTAFDLSSVRADAQFERVGLTMNRVTGTDADGFPLLELIYSNPDPLGYEG